MNSTHDQQGGESLGTLLREAAAREILPPRPVAQTVRHAEVRRTRRRVTASVLALAVVAGGGVMARELLQPAPRASQLPAQSVTTPGPTPSAPEPSPNATQGPSSVSPAVTSGDSATTTTTGSRNSASTWPAPPTDHIFKPYDRAGVDIGEIVGLRRDGDRVVATVNRQQYFTRAQWKQRTGEDIDTDGRLLDESARTRDFVVEPGAAVFADWTFHEDGSTPRERLTADQLVTRGKEVLARMRADGVEHPGILVWMFHRGGQDGPLAYVDDAAPEIG